MCRFRETAERSSSSGSSARGASRGLGEEIGRLLGRIPSLNAERWRAPAPSRIEVRSLSTSVGALGIELAILPFELARAPQAFPGEGLDLCLQEACRSL